MRRSLPDALVDIAQERSRQAAHGRWETRTLWALHSADLNAYLGSAGTVGQVWPGVAQVLRLQRVVQTTDRATGQRQTRTEVAYAITSLPPEQATATDLLVRWRAHWHSENRLHWVRDGTLAEDARPIHVGQAPLVFAVLRTAVLALLPQVGAASLAAAQRDLALHPTGVLALFQYLARRLTARTHATARLRLAVCPPPAAPLPTRLAS